MTFPPGPGQQPEYVQHPPPVPPSPPAGARDGTRIGVGLALLALPVLAALFAYVLPTIQTFALSLQNGVPFFEDTEYVGFENYTRAVEDFAFFDSFTVVAPVILVTLVAGAVIAPLVAWCLHQAGAATRMASRIAWGLGAVLFAPAGMTVAWYADHSVSAYLDGDAWESVSLLDWASLISGVVLGAGILVALAAFRGGTDTGKKAATVLTAAGLTAIALVAAGLQTFTFPYVTGIPRPPDRTPIAAVFEAGLMRFDYGPGSAMSILLMIVLAVLGVGAALLFLLTRTRIDVAPDPGQPRRFHIGAGLAGIVLLVLLAAGVVVSLWPWLSRLTEAPVGDRASTTDVLVNTWVPALITTTIALTASVAGGLALGALRPLGDGSRWLLLLFAPWLFVGSGPLALAGYEALAEADAVGDYMSLPPRAWIAVPALFVLTALFWGLEDRRRSMLLAGAPPSKANGAFAAAAWPMVALVGMFMWMVNAQDTVWQYVTYRPGTAILALVDELRSGSPGRISPETGELEVVLGVGLGYPIAMLVLFAAAIVVAAIFYLPRVGIRVGR